MERKAIVGPSVATALKWRYYRQQQVNQIQSKRCEWMPTSTPCLHKQICAFGVVRSQGEGDMRWCLATVDTQSLLNGVASTNTYAMVQ
jgi:hypothetical protein